MPLLRRLLLLALALALLLPVLALAAAWLQWNAASAEALRNMATTVLPDYVLTTLLLCALVTLGVVSLGVGGATAVTLFDFPGRRTAEWLLLLPLAMPAYVVAYAYTDFLQFSGPFQTTVRELTGLQGRVFPEVRSVWGAAWVLSFALYPYVYLLTRSALSERATRLMEAARLLGAPLSRRIRRVAWPLARPAVVAGVALALMETLADYGVVSYFGIQTFTAGIYKAWLVLDDRIAAAQLATLLLGAVALVLLLERHAHARLRYATRDGATATQRANHVDDSRAVRLHGLRAAVAWSLCAVPVLMGFVLPIVFMLRPLWGDEHAVDLARFAGWAWNSLRLAGITALLALGIALALAAVSRQRRDALTQGVVQLAGLGYAVPGAVVVVGLLLPVVWLQQHWPQATVGALMTTTALGLVWAYLVRFSGVALQSVQSGYTRVPASYDDSARMLGASPWRLWRRVHWPLLKKPALAALLLVFVDVMKELPATLVLRPFNSDTLAVVAYQLARDERLGEAALPSLALVLVGLIPVVLLSRTLRSESAAHPSDLA